jgi:hypothetical protein
MSKITLKKEPLPGFIAYEWLIRNGACADAEIFKEMYPEGVQVTEEVIDELLDEGVDVEFFIRVAYETYEDKLRELFHKKTFRNYKKYKEIVEKARKEFARERVLALYDLSRTSNLSTREGEQYRLDF